MEKIQRREFLRNSGLAMLPALLPGSLAAIPASAATDPATAPLVNFVTDTLLHTPADRISQLQQLQQTSSIEQDFYGQGGVVKALEQKFAAITGKESAKFFPTGTMANQLALKVLSGDNTKIFLQETSHIFRDEADAAQSVHGKRLMPIAKGAAAFTLEDLQQAIDYQEKEEVFHSGIGAISVETPVRRCDGRVVPLEELKRISAWCRSKGYPLHLDGARIHFACAFRNIPLATYSALFDTVYISLYKYLGAMGGAILCGDKKILDKMEHLIKIHGGTLFQHWPNAALALHHLEGIDDRLRQTATSATALFARLNKLKGIHISALPDGSNIFHLKTDAGIDIAKWAGTLRTKHNIIIPRQSEDGMIKMVVNESLLLRSEQELYDTFSNSLRQV